MDLNQFGDCRLHFRQCGVLHNGEPNGGAEWGCCSRGEFISAIWAAAWQNQQNEFAPSEDSDQPGHPPSLIRVFAVRSVGT